ESSEDGCAHVGEERTNRREGVRLDMAEGVALRHAENSICRVLRPAGWRALGGVRVAFYSRAIPQFAWPLRAHGNPSSERNCRFGSRPKNYRRVADERSGFLRCAAE